MHRYKTKKPPRRLRKQIERFNKPHGILDSGRYDKFGQGVRHGWVIPLQLIKDHMHHLHREGVVIDIHQVKEKFGTLRFYYGWHLVEDQVLLVTEEMREQMAEKYPHHPGTADATHGQVYSYFIEDGETEKDSVRDVPLPFDLHDRLREFSGVVQAAENLSCYTCEVCGNPGRRRSMGWILTLCDGCHVRRRISNYLRMVEGRLCRLPILKQLRQLHNKRLFKKWDKEYQARCLVAEQLKLQQEAEEDIPELKEDEGAVSSENE